MPNNEDVDFSGLVFHEWKYFHKLSSCENLVVIK